MDIAKAGWLLRQSTVLHRWKKYWFVLNQAGELRYFESPDSHNPEEKFVLRAVVLEVKAGEYCNFSPPEGKSRTCLLQLKMRDDNDLRLCAESTDDMKAWQLAFEDAIAINRGAPGSVVPPGSQVVYPHVLSNYTYPGQVIATTPGTYVVHNAASGTGQTMVLGSSTPNVVYMDEPRYYRHRCYRGGYWWW